MVGETGRGQGESALFRGRVPSIIFVWQAASRPITLVRSGVILKHTRSKGRVLMSRPVQHGLSGLALLIFLFVGHPDPARPSTSGPIQGVVVTVTTGVPGTMVIRDEKGGLHILKLTQQTQLGAQFKPGDKVVAFTSPYGVSAVQLQTGNP